MVDAPLGPLGGDVRHEGKDCCVAARAIIETGFMCPPELPFMYPGDSFTVCAPMSDVSPELNNAVGHQAGFGPYDRKLDVVVVVQKSSSMCARHNALADALDHLATELDRLGVDVRVGVTSPDMGCGGDATVHAAGGRFATMADAPGVMACQHRVVERCTVDADCDDALGDAGAWRCDSAGSSDVAERCTENPNGSLNSRCARLCTADAECAALLGEPTATCRAATGTCFVPARIDACPSPVVGGGRAWLASGELDRLRCLAYVGEITPPCYQYSEGLAAALAAIDPSGPNPEQAAGFLRDDAHLAVIVVNDRDDCSVAPGESLDWRYHSRCALLGDTSEGGPLHPVVDLARDLLVLKDQGREIFVAVAAGDSLAADEASREAEREAFAASKDSPWHCHHATFICDGEHGVADHGRRHLEFARVFGANAVTANICEDAPMDRLIERFLVMLEGRLQP